MGGEFNGTRSIHSIHSILTPAMTLYDTKPQSVKIPVAAKSSGISPNHMRMPINVH